MGDDHSYDVYNLGQGRGSSVLDLIAGVEAATGLTIPYEVAERRAGDIAECVADPTRANKELSWKTKRSTADACRDSWASQSR